MEGKSSPQENFYNNFALYQQGEINKENFRAGLLNLH
jgi:hypothetical protein